jgi:hypothetical protein
LTYFGVGNILFKSRKPVLFEEKGELLTTNMIEAENMIDEIFESLLDSEDGDYIFQAQILAAMKPDGW